MSNKFISSYFTILIILIIITNISFAQNSDFGNFVFSDLNKEFQNSNFHYNKDSKYMWPIFGYYTISSYFGKRESPTSRSINLPFWN